MIFDEINMAACTYRYVIVTYRCMCNPDFTDKEQNCKTPTDGPPSPFECVATI